LIFAAILQKIKTWKWHAIFKFCKDSRLKNSVKLIQIPFMERKSSNSMDQPNSIYLTLSPIPMESIPASAPIKHMWGREQEHPLFFGDKINLDGTQIFPDFAEVLLTLSNLKVLFIFRKT